MSRLNQEEEVGAIPYVLVQEEFPKWGWLSRASWHTLYQKARNACGSDIVPRKPGGSLAARSANLFCFVQGILEGFFVDCFQLGIFSLYVLEMLSLPSSGCLPLNSRAHLFKSCSGDVCGFKVLQADSGMTAGL